MDKSIGIAKRCPHCNWRILDKVTVTSGIIEMKCPKCKKVVKINLNFRKADVKYRTA
ncbi:MAG: hypothetical protein ACI4DY_10240 [Monoglobaceae bacterium]